MMALDRLLCLCERGAFGMLAPRRRIEEKNRGARRFVVDSPCAGGIVLLTADWHHETAPWTEGIARGQHSARDWPEEDSDSSRLDDFRVVLPVW